MTSPFTAHQAGIASIIAAILMLASQITQLVLPLTLPESFWITTQSLRMGLAFAAMFALLVALTGLYARQAHSTGRLGLIAYLTASLGTLLVAGDWWYEAFVGPALRAQAPELLATAPAGSILIGAILTTVSFAAGWLLFGLVSFRAAVLPRSASDPDDHRGCCGDPRADRAVPGPTCPRGRLARPMARQRGRPAGSEARCGAACGLPSRSPCEAQVARSDRERDLDPVLDDADRVVAESADAGQAPGLGLRAGRIHLGIPAGLRPGRVADPVRIESAGGRHLRGVAGLEVEPSLVQRALDDAAIEDADRQGR